MHLLGQPIAASFRLVHRLHQFLEGDLSRRMLEAVASGARADNCGDPMLAAGRNAPMSQKEAQHLLTRAPQHLHRRLPGAGKIAHGFVSVVWNRDWREFTRA